MFIEVNEGVSEIATPGFRRIPVGPLLTLTGHTSLPSGNREQEIVWLLRMEYILLFLLLNKLG